MLMRYLCNGFQSLPPSTGCQRGGGGGVGCRVQAHLMMCDRGDHVKGGTLGGWHCSCCAMMHSCQKRGSSVKPEALVIGQRSGE